MRLIDGDELEEKTWRLKLDSRELIAKMIEDAPTIDAVPIVRCKDCQHWGIHKRLNIPWCREMHIDMGAENFCSMAKRREE